MPLTLRQVIDQIKAVADAHAQINGVGVGDFAELQSQTRVYPLFWIFHERSEVVEGYIVRRIRLLCADRVHTGQEGDDDDGMEIEVLSDTQRILMDFIAYFAQQHNQAYIVDRVGSIDPFTERFDDRVAGNTVLLTIKEAWDYSKCETPISTVTFPPTVDGLTLYDFGDASILGRLTAQQVADLEAAYGSICADATITINSSSYGTVPSGGTENIIVESENNNPLGSLVGGNWEVGNAHLRVNGTTVGNLEPEQWHDHYATINGTQAGSWHNSSQTWRMNVLQGGSPVGSLSGTDWVVPPCADATAVLKNTANTTLSTTSIASGGSANITAPDATAVLKNTANTTLLTEAIPSNVSENITAPDATITLNGAAYGSAPSGTTLNVVTPSLSLSTTTSTPAYGASFTVTATTAGFTPTSYSFGFPSDSVGGYSCTTQVGNSLAITAKGYSTQRIYVTATDGSTTVGAMLTVTVAQMTQVTDFLTNTGIVDATITSAVRTLAMRLDDFGIWSKMRALYPFVGGTATTHKYNLKDPRDLDAAYRMIFAGGWTHNSNGITGNGTNTSGDSRLANNVPSQNSLNMGVYNRTAGTGGVEWSGSSSPRTWLAGNISGTAYFDLNNSASTATTTAPADVRGTLMANRTDSASTELNLNAQGQRTTAAASSAPTATNFILGQFSGGGFNTARNYAAAWIADGLTPLEEANLRTVMQAFQTTLSRQV